MSFVDAVKSCFSRYVTFEGRAGRPEYWWWALFGVIVYVVALIIDIAAKSIIPTVIVLLALLLPSLAVTVRRLHDIGRSGWWWFIGLVPVVGGIILFVFSLMGSDGPNQFGPAPAGPAAIESTATA